LQTDLKDIYEKKTKKSFKREKAEISDGSRLRRNGDSFAQKQRSSEKRKNSV